ncbi:hypothetical protein Pelo_15811 [Pelomyxa schiedti]|nr:hypothetical protein Pelo_15811 [Pelomyxa schiedti]
MDDPEVGVSVPGLCCGDSRFCGVFCDRERCDDALILHCHDGQIVPSGVSCITLTLVDIRKTYVTKSLSTIVQLQCPLPSSQFQLFPTLDELMCATGVVMRKGTATGTLVFVMQIEAKVFLIEQKSEEPSIATASVIALDCSSLSHVSGSFFCIAYNNEVTLRVIRCDDGEVFRQVVGGSGMLFTVCESKNRGNSQNSNGNRVVITDAFTGHHVATVEVVTNGQPDSVYLDDMASLL